MAGEGVFGTMLGRFAGGLTDAQDRQRKQAQIEAQQKRQATLDADAMQTSALERAAGQFKLGQAQEQADADKTFPDLFAKARAGDEGALGSVLRRYPQMAGALTKPEKNPLVVPAGAAVVGPDGKPLFTSEKIGTPIVHTFADGIKQSTDGGRTWVKIGEAPRPESQPTIVQGADPITKEPLFFRVPKGAGPATPIEGITSKVQSNGAAAMQKAVANNKTQVAVIDDALQELSKHPDAVGLKRGLGELPLMGTLGDKVNQRVDPEGVAARASIANIASLKVHDRSGGAVTVSEYPRLAPFIPKVDDNIQTVQTKLKKLRGFIETETGFLQRGAPATGGAGTAPPTYDEWLANKRKP